MSKSSWFAVSLLLFALPAAAERTTGMRGGKPYIEATDQRTLTATVISVDKTSRLLRVRTEDGDTLAVSVDKAVKNFAQIQVSDVVKASITDRVTIEVASGPAMKDTSEVSAMPGKSGEKLQGTLTQRTRRTATITAIDKAAGTVALMGQDGNSFTMTAKHKENLDKVTVGDLVVFTVSKSVAATVEKAGAK